MTGGGFTVLDSGSSSGQFSVSSHIRGPTWLHLPVLTICLLGVQISWSVEMSNASPYLLSLGLSKSAMAVVFVAGPLSGLIVQPLIGVLADNSTSRWGRRRPYMIAGSVVCAGALLLLGWTNVVTGWFGQANSSLVIALAVLSIYVIDFSINAVQAMDRALLVDSLPSVLQPAGNAWAARMLAIGNVVGFFVGNLDLPRYLPFLGSTQLEVLSLIGSFVLLSSHLTTASMVREQILLKKSQSGSVGPIQKFTQELKEIWINMLALPRVIRQICMIQFFAWLGWFPILFYTSVYIGDLNKRAFYATVSVIPPAGSSSSPTPEILASLDTESSRLGSRALFYSSLLTLFMNFALPYFVTEASTNSRRRKQRRHQQTIENGFGSSHNSNGTFGGGMNGTSSPTPDALNRGRNILRQISAFAIPERIQLHLASLWAISHAVFAICMLSTFFTSSVSGASILVGVTGFSWAVTQWVPFALLGEAILTEPSALAEDRASIQLVDTRQRRRSVSITLARASSESRRELSMLNRSDIDSRGGTFTIEESDDDIDGDDGDENNKDHQQMRSTLFGNTAAGVSKIDISRSQDDHQYPHDDEDDGEEAGLVGRARDEEDVGTSDDTDATRGGGLSAKAGIILGIHNIFIVLPQFLVTGLSSIIFALFDPSKSVLHGKHPGTSHRAITTDLTNAITPFSQLLSIRNETSDQEAILEELVELEAAAKSNSVVYIFRLGGVAAFVAFILCWRLSRELRHR